MMGAKFLLLQVSLVLFIQQGYCIFSHKDKFSAVTSLISKKPTHDKVVYVNVDDDEDSCGRNEKWYSCLPKCTITCDNLERDCLRKNYPCRGGCDCKSGYARLSENGPCVNSAQCEDTDDGDDRHRCAENEEWLEGREEPDCDTTCENLIDGCGRRGGRRRGSRGDCYCRRGYARHPQSDRCIRIDRCPSTTTTPAPTRCGTNEEYLTCGDRDDERCSRGWRGGYGGYGGYGGDRDRDCESGCFCKEGYVRISGECRSSSNCPVRCREDEVRRRNRCECRDTFYRSRGRCVCPDGQVNLSGKCEALVKCEGGTVVLSPTNCKGDDCTSQTCVCSLGYQVNANGVCTSICNVATQFYLAVTPTCENVCDPTTPGTAICQAIGATATTLPKNCYCQPNYGFDATSGSCILASTCPP